MNNADPVFGKIWTISAEESNLTNPMILGSETRRYEEAGGGYKLTVIGEREGSSYEWGYTAGYDGESASVYGRPDVDAIEKHRVTDFVTIGSFTKDGEIVASYRRTTSPDGELLTVVASGRCPDGTTYFDVIKYR